MDLRRRFFRLALCGVVTMTGSPAAAQDDGPYPDAVLVASVTEVDFGDVGVGRVREREVTLSNTGGSRATFVSFDFAGSTRFDYDPSSLLRPGAGVHPSMTRRMPLLFSPLAPGSESAILTITYDVNDYPGLDGTATVEIDLTGRGVTTPPALVAEPASKDLGTLAPKKYIDETITVTNRSAVAVGILGLRVSVTSVSFGGSTGTCNDATLGPGETCSLRVRARTFDRGGSFTFTVEFLSDDPQSPLVVTLRGKVPLPPPETTPPVMSQAPGSQALLRAFRKKARYEYTWSASDNVGVTAFQTQLRAIGGGPWKTIFGRSVPVQIGGSQRLTINVPRDRTFRVRTRAFDAAGNVSAWQYLRRTITYRNIRKGTSELTGAWKEVKTSGTPIGGDILVTRERGATLSITTNARSIALLGRRGPSGGWVITGDDETIEMVSLNDRERTDLAVLLSWTWPTVGLRTVRVAARVQKPYRPLVALDAWVIER